VPLTLLSTWQATQRSGTQCNGTRTRWLFGPLRYRLLIEAVHGNLQTTWVNRYTGPLRVRVR
jgi:hypothetical protein